MIDMKTYYIKIRACVWLFLPFLIASCSTHHLEIPQGGEIKSEAITQLHPGMTQAQVQNLLGSAPIKDPFHEGRWDYIFQTIQGKNKVQKTHLVLYFKGDILEKISHKR